MCDKYNNLKKRANSLGVELLEKSKTQYSIVGFSGPDFAALSEVEIYITFMESLI